MYDSDAFFDNNHAKWELRMNENIRLLPMFQSCTGFSRICSFLLTAQKQSVIILEALEDVFSPQPVFFLI